MTNTDKKIIENFKKLLAEGSEDEVFKKGTNNLLFVVLLAEEGCLPSTMPETLKGYLTTRCGEQLESYYNNMCYYIREAQKMAKENKK